jgi:hypothetical protein
LFEVHHPIVCISLIAFVPALLATLALVELSDLMFAVDSIPVILAVTRDPFIVFAPSDGNMHRVCGTRRPGAFRSRAISRCGGII